MDPFQEYDKQRLYDYGKLQLSGFLAINKLEAPTSILTYDEAFAPERRNSYESRVLARLESGPYQGTGTGWYKNGIIFVCLQKAARLVLHPGYQNWSHPHYRVDREPCGVVCHEGGHHVQALLRRFGRFHDGSWREIVRGNRKRVTGYEPVPDEAFAESMRLFILNPGLLQAGLPERFDFIRHHCNLEPHTTLDWRKVLADFHPNFTLQAEKWVAAKS